MAMKWTVDGDQRVSHGTLGQYRITEWCSAAGSNFAISFKAKGKGESGWKGIGEFSTLSNAKSAAETYDGYRSTPKPGTRFRTVTVDEVFDNPTGWLTGSRQGK